MITGKVNGQKLMLDRNLIAADSIGFLTAAFELSGEWGGYTVYAHFANGGSELASGPFELHGGQIVEDDHLDLTTGSWEVWLHGNRTDPDGNLHRATTNIEQLRVVRTGIADGEPFPTLEPSIVERQVQQAHDYAADAGQSAEAAKEYAESAQRAATSFDRAHLKDVAISADGNAAIFTHEDGMTTTFKPKTGGGTVNWADVQNKPESFPPSDHTHSYNDLRDKPSIPEAYDDTEIREQLDTQSAEIAQQKQLMPEATPTVGKLARVAEVFEDGSFRMEWADGGSGGLSGVKVGNKSSVVEESDGVANIKIGIGLNTSADNVAVTFAGDSDIKDRYKGYAAVSPRNMDVFVRTALGDGNGESWTAEQQTSAQQLLGISKEWKLKATITTDTKGDWIPVDLTGCEEVIVKGKYKSTASAIMQFLPQRGAIFTCANNVNGTAFKYYAKTIMGSMTSLYYKAVNNYGYNFYNANGATYDFFEKTVADITGFKFDNPNNITECEIEIWAR